MGYITIKCHVGRRLLVNAEVRFVHVSYNKYCRHELMACYLNFQDFTNGIRINPVSETHRDRGGREDV